MTAGQTATATVVMNNNGTTTWQPASYALVSRNPSGNTIWGLNSVALPGSVAPGSNATLSFTITAPSTAGTYNFQWQLEQSGTAFGAVTANVAIVVNSLGGQPLAITTSSLPFGTKGVPYSAQVSASGGSQPYSWSLSSGQLPAGVTLGSSTGLISGTPVVAGTYTFSVRVRDQIGNVASKTYKVLWR